ncbi:MAG: response regulator [Sphingomonas bacterium]|nr:response regulator [Sphingomonas bacterium]
MTTTDVPRILIVEPHKSGLAVMARRLSEAGYRVVSCGNAGDAVSELHRAPVALLLAELRMTPMSGIELTRLVRDDGALRDLPVILINGRSDSDGACDGLAAGADDIVPKPFDFDVLFAKIARAIERSRSMRELRQDNATLDARVITRAIELSEVKAALHASEAERKRLAARMWVPD